MTQQAVPPDEHPWVETFGRHALYRDFATVSATTTGATTRSPPQPGRGLPQPRTPTCPAYATSRAWPWPSCSEMLAPYVSGGCVLVLLNHRAVHADVEGTGSAP